MRAVPLDDLHGPPRQRVLVLVEGLVEHVEVREAEAGVIGLVGGELRGVAMAPVELTQVLGADGLDSVGVDLLHGGQGEIARHEQIAPAEREEHRVFARGLR